MNEGWIEGGREGGEDWKNWDMWSDMSQIYLRPQCVFG